MILNNLIVNYGLTLKFPKSNEYNSPEGTREIILKKMAKKDYKSPEMKEVKVNVEQDLLAGSCAAPDGVGTDATTITCDCSTNDPSDNV